MGPVPPIAIAALAVVGALVLVALLYAQNYVKVPPNMVAVFTGRGRQKIVRGGARFKMPIIERVDFMSLEPFNVEVSVTNVYSTNGVPVNVTGVGLIRFGSEDGMIATAVERFLTSRRESLGDQVREILSGNMRSIVSQMTVEELNSNRDELRRRVLEEAAEAFKPIGMQLDVLTIQNISDNNGYLDALGQTRIAEVKRDAEIGQAEAKRDAMIKSAAADQEGKTAEAQAATQIAEAERTRDIELARYSAEVERGRATAAQAGPLAEAEARRAVVIAEANVRQEQEKAGIEVERQRALRAREAAQADTIVPAEAEREAAILRAEGVRQAAILEAEAEAEARRLEGDSEAHARKAQAQALKEEMVARAEGERATLEAQAAGQKDLAEALNAFTSQAMQLQLIPQVITQLPQVAQSVTSAIGQIDKLVVVDNGGGNGEGGDTITKLTGIAPAAIAAVMETIRATTGVDLQGVINTDSSQQVSTNGSPAVSQRPVTASLSPDGATAAE